MRLLALANSVSGIQRLLLTAWVGGMWAIGYLATPVLFASLDDRMLAGALAGQLFTKLSWVGLVCGVLILLLQWRAKAARLPRIVVGCIVLMLAITVVGQFVIQPIMVNLKAQAGPGVVMAGAVRERFGMWHGISSVLFLCCSVLGALAVWRAVPSTRRS